MEFNETFTDSLLYNTCTVLHLFSDFDLKSIWKSKGEFFKWGRGGINSVSRLFSFYMTLFYVFTLESGKEVNSLLDYSRRHINNILLKFE